MPPKGGHPAALPSGPLGSLTYNLAKLLQMLGTTPNIRPESWHKGYGAT
jgi:hypothetical protein